MKRYLVLLAAGLLLAACQVPVGSGGTLKVVLPGSGARATLSNSTAVRLQLTRNNVVVPLSGGDYIEKSLGGQTVSVDGLAPGPGYVLLVSTGHRGTGTSTNFYVTDLFQKSSAFEISAGTDTAVTVTLDDTNVAVVEANDNSAHSATVMSGALYYLDGTQVSSVTNLNGGTVASTVLSYASNIAGGVSSVNSLSNDGSLLWLNTNAGIAVQGGGSFPSPSMTDGNSQPLSPQPSVTDSGKINLGSSLSYYYGAKLNAGLDVGGNGWSTMDQLLKFSSDLKNKLNGQIIRGVASTGNFAVVATSIGAFRVESSMLSSDAATLGTDFTNGTDSSATSILLQPSDTSLLIGPVSAISSSGTNMIFGGTVNGLYASSVDTSGAPTAGDHESLTLVPGTQGLNITKLATYGNLVNGTDVRTAAYSANTREILVLQGTTVANRISGFAGLPSGDLRLTFYEDSNSDLYLVVTGSDATVKIKITHDVVT